MKSVPNINSSGFPFRGSMFINKLTEDQSGIKYEYRKQLSEFNSKTVQPVWFLFPGLGGQWTAMAKALMPIKVFADKVEECHQILSEFGINLKYLLLSEDKTAISTMSAKFCATTSIEIALFEVMKALDITPDGIIGHSFGEIACAYADGCLTTKQAMFTTYIRGFITENDKKNNKGFDGCVWSEQS
jgi:acyl transferase domain-containing protein